MSAKATQADNSTGPEISDERLEQISDDVLDYCDEVFDLDRHVNSLHIPQLDEPWCDDSREVRFFLDTKRGHTTATIISEVLDSHLPLKIESTNPGYQQLTFHVTD